MLFCLHLTFAFERIKFAKFNFNENLKISLKKEVSILSKTDKKSKSTNFDILKKWFEQNFDSLIPLDAPPPLIRCCCNERNEGVTKFLTSSG